MSAVTNIWRQLVQRRLWPVAIALIAALVAVPLTLAKDPEPQPAEPLAQADTKSELATTPIVAPASPADRSKRRRVLGTKKNPFAAPKATAAETNGPSTTDGPSDSGSGASDASNPGTPVAGGSVPSGGAPSVPAGGSPVAPTPAPSEPGAKPVKRERHSLTVRFGGEDALERMNVKLLEALPIAEEPLVVYDRIADDGRSAVFLIDTTVSAEGDGRCEPDPNTCETIRLREGETEFFDIVGANGESVGQYQLDLIEIHGAKKKSAGRTASARAAAPGALQDRAETAGVARTAVAGLALP